MPSPFQRLADSLRPERPVIVRLSPSDEADFWTDQWRNGLRNWQTFLLLASLGMLVWWPLDWILPAARPGLREVYAVARGTTVVCGTLTFILVRRALSFPRFIFFSSVVSTFIAASAWGWALGAMGPPHELWFVMMTPEVFLPVVWAFPLRVRIGVTLVIVGASIFGYFGLHPGYLKDSLAALAISDMAFGAVFSVLVGFLTDQLRRQTFALRRSDAQRARSLEEFNATLESRVREQTSQLRQLTLHLESVREAERAHISRELHDELGQELAALGLAVDLSRARYGQNPADIASNLAVVDSLVRRTRETVRHIVTELRPRVLDDLGLPAAVEWLARRTEERSGVACDVTIPKDDLKLDGPVAVAVFRIAQESLTNVARHARATSVHIRLWKEQEQLHLRVQDDGVGLPPQGQRVAGMGIPGMRERALALDGDLRIDGAPGAGTLVHAWVPAREIAA